MIAKLLAGAVALVLSAPVPSSQAEVFTQHPYIHRMDCLEGKGTAFQVNSHTALTVNHVASLTDCRIDGIPVETIEQDENDFAIIRYPFRRPGGLRLSCEGYRNEETYMAIGYAKGLPVQRVLPTKYWRELPKLPGSKWATLFSPVPFIPGMSGGPVFNGRGAVVGTVNAYNPFMPLSFSLPLSETSLCRGAGAIA